MENITIIEKFAKMWKQSRLDAGKSQDYMAKALGVSKKTVQNWEAGYACPNQLQGFKWFEALDLPALPYYLKLLYGSYENASPSSTDDEIKASLLEVANNLTPDLSRKLLYILSGEHGSDVPALIELFLAYVYTPLPARVGVGQLIYTNYEIAEAYNRLNDHVKPNKEHLANAIAKGIKSVEDKRKTYTGGMLE